MSADRDWLAGLQAGDEVAISNGVGGPDRIRKVEHATATQITVDRVKFRRSDGRVRGESSRWFRSYLVQPTPEVRDRLERRDLAARFAHHVRWDALPLDRLRAVAAVLDAGPAAQEIDG